MENKIYDIVIVGAGTAGLSAAIYALRAGKSVLVLEEKSYGGQIVVTPEIENYPGIAKISGFDFAQGLYDQAKALGMEYVTGRVTKIENGSASSELEAAELTEASENASGQLFQILTDGKKSFAGRSVILATGAKNRPLDIDREQDFIGSGISYCATCDGMFFRNREVAVVGGGNTALEDALFLSEYCSKVYLIHRREGFRGEPSKLEAVKKKENIELVCNSVVTSIASDEDDTMQGVHIWNKKEEKESTLPVAGLFIAIGQMPDNEAFAGLAQLDEKGYIRAGEDCHTTTEGIFVAGDCRTKKVRQLTTAASDGAVAALAACEYLQ